jgi:hypothetical protein
LGICVVRLTTKFQIKYDTSLAYNIYTLLCAVIFTKMTQEKRTVKMIISIDVDTTKSVDEIKRALERGIYRGLDTEPNYVAPPKDVKINYCQER